MVAKRNITLYMESDLLDRFQQKVGHGNVSTTMEALIRKFVNFDQTKQTQEEFLESCAEQEALSEISLDPYEKIKFEYECTKDASLTAVKYLNKMKKK